jgi:hypothetical protein
MTLRPDPFEILGLIGLPIGFALNNCPDNRQTEKMAGGVAGANSRGGGLAHESL